MTEVHSFPPIAAPDATRLILGTMPGEMSLARAQYYGHARNAFWPLMLDLLQLPATLDYPARCAALREHRIAVWDVLRSCHRVGSLDSAIAKDTMVANDFIAFFTAHPHIRRVCFNGGPAHQLWRRLVQPVLSPARITLDLQVLPSTSPAHAAMSLAEKRKRWHIVLDED